MILKLEIENFRSYKNKTIFSLEATSSKLKINNYKNVAGKKVLKSSFIYGANASGKSNIVRALFEIRKFIINKPKIGDDLTIYDPFLFDSNTDKKPVIFNLDFVIDEIKYSYNFSIDNNVVKTETLKYYPNNKVTILFERDKYDKNKTVQYGTLGDSKKKKKIQVFSNQLLLSKFGDDEPNELITKVFLYFKELYVYNATNRLHYEVLNANVNEAVLKNVELKKKLEILIQNADTKIIGLNLFTNENDPKTEVVLDNVKWIKNNYSVCGVHQYFNGKKNIGKKELPFKEESVGSQNLYTLGAKIIEALEIGSVLVVDELDTSLHPFITRMILMMFLDDDLNTNGAQLIFTTHDVTLLDQDLVRKDQVWITEKNQEGSTDLYSLQDFEGLREDTPFEKWYLAGKFGGLPQIKNLKKSFTNER